MLDGAALDRLFRAAQACGLEAGPMPGWDGRSGILVDPDYVDPGHGDPSWLRFRALRQASGEACRLL